MGWKRWKLVWEIEQQNIFHKNLSRSSHWDLSKASCLFFRPTEYQFKSEQVMWSSHRNVNINVDLLRAEAFISIVGFAKIFSSATWSRKSVIDCEVLETDSTKVCSGMFYTAEHPNIKFVCVAWVQDKMCTDLIHGEFSSLFACVI